MKRRQFLKTTAIATAGLTCGADSRASEETTDQVIDIHQHVNFRKRENEAFLEHQKVMGIRKTILLPAGTPMNRPSTRLGKGNGLAADVSGTQEAADFVKKHPESYAFFCNEVPDSKDAVERIEQLAGARCYRDWRIQISSGNRLATHASTLRNRPSLEGAHPHALSTSDLQHGFRAITKDPGEVSDG